MKRGNRISVTLGMSCLAIALCLVYTNNYPTRSLAVSPAPAKSVDLRGKISSFNIPIKNQGGRNTCSLYATTFLLEYETAKASNQSGLDFSEDYLNAVTDIVKGKKDDGDFFNNVLNGYLKFGTVDESDFPNTATYKPDNVPSAALLNDGKANIKFVPVFIRQDPGGPDPWGLTDAHINQIIAQLDAGRPLAAGWRLALGGAIENVKILGLDVWSKNVIKTATDFTGHSMPIVGYVKDMAGAGGYFIIRHSGGTDWGEKGYWYCTFDFAKQNIADVFYLAPKPRVLNLRLPELINTPVPRYMRVEELRKLPNNSSPKTKAIILQKNG